MNESSSGNFPGPKYNRIIEQDPQIIRVPMDHTDFGARPVAIPNKITNEMVIKHVNTD